MKLFDKISNGYKKIASGIAIVAFLTMLYFAMIPGGSLAGLSSVTALSGTPIVGALVKLVDYPQYNATTDGNGNFTMQNVPEGTYRISASMPGYFRNVSNVTVVGNQTVSKNFALSVATNMSMPWTATQGGWTTPFVIANKGLLNTSVNISYYNAANGSNVGNYSLVLQPGASTFVFRQWTTSTTDGSAVISSEDPISGVVYQLSGSTLGAYEVDPSGSTEVFLPWIDETGGWTTPFVIANQGNQTARIDITYYFINGTVAGNYTDYIITGASKFVFRSWTTASAGAAKISSNQTISVVAEMLGPKGEFGAYTPSSLVSNQVFVPWTAASGGWSTPIKIVNRGTGTATVNLSYYGQADGQLKGTDSVIISPNGVVDIYRENTTANGTDGSAILNSTQPVSVIVVQKTTSMYEAYTPSLVTSNTIVIPWLATTGGWTTPYVVVNKGSANATVNIKYYNAADGSFVGNYTISNLMPSASTFVFREWTAPGTDGSAVLVSDQPITGVVELLNGPTFGSYTALG